MDEYGQKINTDDRLSIFVGGLASTVTNEELFQYFSKFGIIESCEVQVWKNNPEKCRGFAIVKVSDDLTYNNILGSIHRLSGRPIECKKMIKDREALNEYNSDLMERKLFVSGLAKSVDDLMLWDFFSQFGPLEMAYIIKHHKDLKSKGFGFVCFCRREDKEKVLKENCWTILDKPIFCTNYSAKSETKNVPRSQLDVKDNEGNHKSGEIGKVVKTQKGSQKGQGSTDSGNSTKNLDRFNPASNCVKKKFSGISEENQGLDKSNLPEISISSRTLFGNTHTLKPQIQDQRLRHQSQSETFNVFVGGDIFKSPLSLWITNPQRANKNITQKYSFRENYQKYK